MYDQQIQTFFSKKCLIPQVPAPASGHQQRQRMEVRLAALIHERIPVRQAYPATPPYTDKELNKKKKRGGGVALRFSLL